VENIIQHKNKISRAKNNNIEETYRACVKKKFLEKNKQTNKKI